MNETDITEIIKGVIDSQMDAAMLNIHSNMTQEEIIREYDTACIPLGLVSLRAGLDCGAVARQISENRELIKDAIAKERSNADVD